MAGSNEFGGRLFALREENNINKTELAKILNMSRSMITMYESGERMPSIEVLLKISDYFSVSIDWLLGRTENKQLTINKDHVPLGRTVKIPIIKTAITETPVDSIQNIEDYIETPAEQVRGADFFYIKNGCTYLIRKQDDVQDGEIAAILTDNKISLKHVKKYNDLIILYNHESINEMQVFKRGAVRIVGKAIKSEKQLSSNEFPATQKNG